ncbi:MAG: hypothetical protein PVG66_09805 [Chromatiales bacterium]|jgi:hypothetical protein
MKMLTHDGNQQHLMALKDRLEAHGIPAVIQGTETARMIIPALLLEPTLWVYLDEQFDDAVHLISNPDHRVTTGIDVEAFYAAQGSEEDATNATNTALREIALVVILVLGLMLLLIQILNAL